MLPPSEPSTSAAAPDVTRDPGVGRTDADVDAALTKRTTGLRWWVLAVAILIPGLAGLLVLAGWRAGWFGLAGGGGLMVLLCAAGFGAVLWVGVGRVERLRRALIARTQAAVRYEDLVDSSTEAIIGQTPDGVITSWNPSAEKLFGYPAALIVGQSSPQLFPAVQEALRRMGGGERVAPFETQGVRRDGSRVELALALSPFVDEAGRVVGGWIVARDLSERQRRVLQLEASSREISDFKTALDQHAIVAITDPQGKITYANDKFCAISGYSRAELIGEDHRLLNSGHHPKDYFVDLWRTIAAGQVWQGEICNRAKDGRRYWVYSTIVPFLDEQGRPSQYVSVRTDITMIKQTQERLARSNRDLEQFAYVASHDLQEPLRAVSGCMQILQRRYEKQLDERAVELIGHAVDGAGRMQTLIEGLLLFSRVGTEESAMEQVAMNDVVAMALQNLSAAKRESNGQVRVGVLPTVQAARLQMVLLFQNLIGNALKFRGAADPVVEISAERSELGWRFKVSDNGIGIAPQHLERIFVIFQRLHTRREFPGTGLGLAICKKIVERHGGKIWLDPNVSEGSTFCFELPDPR